MSEHDRKLQFKKICQMYGKDLQRFIYTLTRKDQFATEEIFQNTMLEALKCLSNLRDSRKMKSWIYSIAKAESNRYYAANPMDHRLNFKEAEEDGVWTPAENCSDFTADIANKDLVRGMINRLTEEEQQICILYYYYDLPLREFIRAAA